MHCGKEHRRHKHQHQHRWSEALRQHQHQHWHHEHQSKAASHRLLLPSQPNESILWSVGEASQEAFQQNHDPRDRKDAQDQMNIQERKDAQDQMDKRYQLFPIPKDHDAQNLLPLRLLQQSRNQRQGKELKQ